MVPPHAIDTKNPAAVAAVVKAAFAQIGAQASFPLIDRLFGRWRDIVAHSEGTAFIVEVPLLFEKGLENWFDFTICVTTDSASQLRRLEQRGIPPELAHQRLVKQLPLARKCELADHVLLNDGTPAFLREQVDALADRLLKS